MQFEENFLRRVSSLVQDSDLDFWRKGRFLVRSDNQLVSYKDGIHNYCFLLFFCSVPVYVKVLFGVLTISSFRLIPNLYFRNDPPIEIMENMEYP